MCCQAMHVNAVAARPLRPRIALSVQSAIRDDRIPARHLLRKWVAGAAARDIELTIRFVDVAEGRTLNRTYRGANHATNVLSFVYDNRPEHVCGDLVLCWPVLQRESADQRKALEAHCAHLVVHGVLHLQGYDHEDAEDAAAMEAHERAILNRLGFPDPYAPSPPAPPRRRKA